MMDWKIICKDSKSILLILLNIFIILGMTCMNVEILSSLFQFYFGFLFTLVTIILMLMHQSNNYIIYRNLFVENRSTSFQKTMLYILRADIKVLLLYWVLNAVFYGGILFITGNTRIEIWLLYSFLMFIWMFFYTVMKHQLYLLIKDFMKATLFISIIIVVLRIVNAYFFTFYDNLLVAVFAFIISCVVTVNIIFSTKSIDIEV